MPTIKKEKNAPDSPDAKPEVVLAQIMGREINTEYLTLRVQDGECGWRKARLRIPRRMIQFYKVRTTVRVVGTNDPMLFEPAPLNL